MTLPTLSWAALDARLAAQRARLAALGLTTLLALGACAAPDTGPDTGPYGRPSFAQALGDGLTAASEHHYRAADRWRPVRIEVEPEYRYTAPPGERTRYTF